MKDENFKRRLQESFLDEKLSSEEKDQIMKQLSLSRKETAFTDMTMTRHPSIDGES